MSLACTRQAREAHRSWCTWSAPAKIAQPPRTQSALKYSAKRGFLRTARFNLETGSVRPARFDTSRQAVTRENTGAQASTRGPGQQLRPPARCRIPCSRACLTGLRRLQQTDSELKEARKQQRAKHEPLKLCLPGSDLVSTLLRSVYVRTALLRPGRRSCKHSTTSTHQSSTNLSTLNKEYVSKRQCAHRSG